LTSSENATSKVRTILLLAVAPCIKEICVFQCHQQRYSLKQINLLTLILSA